MACTRSRKLKSDIRVCIIIQYVKVLSFYSRKGFPGSLFSFGDRVLQVFLFQSLSGDALYGTAAFAS